MLTARDLREAERREPTLFDAINRLIGTGLRGRSVTVGLAGGGLTQSAASIMTSPLSSCSADANIRDALQSMLREHVGSLVVVDAAEQLRGMVTFRTLAKRLTEPGVDAAMEPVENALQPATTIADDTPLWQAQDVQERDRCKYLVVTQDGRPVGILSQTDIVHELRAHQSGPYSPISHATSYEELAERFLAIDSIAANALETNRRARVAIRLLRAPPLAIHRR